MADLLVDQNHQEWRETVGTIRLISYGILAASLCILIKWILEKSFTG
jgi:hypothetical protein